MKRMIRINPADNVAVVLADDAEIPRGHKLALRPIEVGEPVIKYGYPIGHATRRIEAGEWVHTHNLATSLSDNLDYVYTPADTRDAGVGEASLTEGDSPLVRGYLRSDGSMGIRNELWILPTVGCVNGCAETLARRLREEYGLRDNIDDIKAFTHNYGCSQLGDDHRNTRRALAALACHPNAGGVIVLGLGCENNRISELREEISRFYRESSGADTPDAQYEERIRFLVAQDVPDEIEAGIGLGKDLLERMSRDRRELLPVSKLKVGLKCGGSDGLSGITANPLVGLLSDRLLGWGATTVLTEVPEMFGAETILMSRAENRDIFDAEVRLINDFKDYFRSCGQPIYENPSPGNKAGGITTLEEKSLGCIQKGGSGKVVDVLGYGTPLVKRGLNLLNAPGNDLVASTALALAGCQMVLFTTGRGTPFGTCVPTLKISTNTQLAESKPGWIDFDAGTLTGVETFESALDRLTEEVLAVADGRKVRQECNGFKEIAVFKTGVTL